MGRLKQLWDPTLLFHSSNQSRRYAVVILNQPVPEAHKATFKRIWAEATLRLCADGGANRLYDTYGEESILPHEIRGDLDSLREDVKAFFVQQGVTVIKERSQYSTDLQKCILRIEDYEHEHQSNDLEIFILGGLSGVEQVKKIREKRANAEDDEYVTLRRRKHAWVLSENSLAWVLPKGTHNIAVDKTRFGPTCGVLPFASQVQGEKPSGTRIWTQGLRWDLDGTPSAIGSFVSTSNHLSEDKVTVTNEEEVIWTIELRQD